MYQDIFQELNNEISRQATSKYYIDKFTYEVVELNKSITGYENGIKHLDERIKNIEQELRLETIFKKYMNYNKEFQRQTLIDLSANLRNLKNEKEQAERELYILKHKSADLTKEINLLKNAILYFAHCRHEVSTLNNRLEDNNVFEEMPVEEYKIENSNDNEFISYVDQYYQDKDSINNDSDYCIVIDSNNNATKTLRIR